MRSDPDKIAPDTPILTLFIVGAVIIGGPVSIYLLFTYWPESSQRQVVVVIGVLAVSLLAAVRRKYDVLLLLLLFFSQFKISLHTIPLNEPAQFQIFFSDLLLILIVLAAFERRERIGFDSVGWVFLVFLIWQAIATVFSAHLHRSVLFLFWQFKYFVVYLLISNFELPEKFASRVRTVVLLMLILQGGIAVAQQINGHPLGLVVIGEQDASRLFHVKGGLRVSGTIGATNAFAGYIASLLVFSLSYLFLRRLPLLYGAFGLGCAGLLFSLSRAGWLSCILGGSFAIVSILRARIIRLSRAIILGIVGLCLIAAGVALYFEKIQDRFQDEKAISSAMGRYYQYFEAWSVIKQYPVFGIGPGITEYYGAWNDNKKFVEKKLRDVKMGNQIHSSQVQFWIESGTPGFIMFMVLIALTVITAFRKFNPTPQAIEETLMRIAAGAAAIAAMTHATFGTEINNHQIFLNFWIFFGLARNRTNIRMVSGK